MRCTFRPFAGLCLFFILFYGGLLYILPTQCFPFLHHSPKNHSPKSKSSSQNSDLEVKFSENLLNINANGVPLKRVIKNISNETGTFFILRGGAEIIVNADIVKLPVEKAIRKLTRGGSYVFVYEKNDTGAAPSIPKLVYIFSNSSDPEAVFGESAYKTDPVFNNSFHNSNSLSEAFEMLKEETFEGNAKALSQMIEIALHAEAESSRVASIEVLSSIGNKQSVVNALIQALGDDEANVRAASVRALRQFGGQKVLDALKNSLRDPVLEVRNSAMVAIDELFIGEQKEPDPTF